MEDQEPTVKMSNDAVGATATPSDAGAEDPIFAYAHGAGEDQNHRRRKGRRLVTISAGLVLVLVVSLVATGVSGPGSKDADAQVELGARTTLAAGSATLTISGSLTANGQSIPITGSGFANLSTGLESVMMSFNANGTALNETELTDGANAYMQISVNGQNEVAQLVPGKDWVDLPTAASSTSKLGSSAPNILSQLQVLTQQGNTVVSLGSSTIDGVAVTGYQVTFSQDAMAAAAKRVEKLSAAESQAVTAVIHEFTKSPPVMKLWIDANHLLRREEVSIGVSTSTGTVSSDAVIDFSDYGTPISVSIPAAGDVASYSAFMAAAQAAG
jgi:hypothetical protein